MSEDKEQYEPAIRVEQPVSVDELTCQCDCERRVAELEVSQFSLGEKVIRLRQALGGLPDGDPMQFSWLPLDEMLDLALGDAQRLKARTAELEAERDRYRAALEFIGRGIWTAPNSIESILWNVWQALNGE
ncbi:hypothetical protein [Nitrolancea hollandica]|uniref:hypothetical protein n=1 Tax=Nitrolancea hollandica TaxID=1206749 RepID=UPI00030439CA|nr:hypothetical protein [Nitrolancea hollandica]